MSATGTYRGTYSHKTVGRGKLPDFESSPASHIPRPRPDNSSISSSHTAQTPHTPSSDIGSSTMSASAASSRQRQTQSKRDEAIRRKIEADLSKKKHQPGRAHRSRKAPPGTVLALKPSQALQIKPSMSIAEAAQLMAAKREDCVLVTDDDDRIAGIFTAKDLAFRVVGAGSKAREVTVSEIMTKNPLCARTDTSATDALDLMVRKGFRHLPVMDENQDISGVLDITKCFYDAMEKLERAYSSSRKLYDALEGVQTELGSSQPQQIIQYVEALRSKMSGPTLETVLDGMPPTTVSVRTSVKEAAALMKEHHTTALLVQDQGSITGIFTSKDVVLRVIAPGLDPSTCSVVRVMTPHPDFAPADMSIQAALRKMHDGHYLNLPVMNDAGEIVGMVDVLKLTYATLEQINSMSTADDEGPAWNKFWLSMDHESDSMVSGSQQHAPPTAHRSVISPESPRHTFDARDSVLPNESASHHGGDEHSEFIGSHHGELAPFPFKFKAPSGRVHRVNILPSAGIVELVSQVSAKLGPELEAVGGAAVCEDGKLSNTGYALSYMDNEGDTVSITTDQDLADAILLSRHSRRDKVDLFVHDPTQPPVPAPAEPAPAPVPVPAPIPVEEKSSTVSEDTVEEPLVSRTRSQTFPPRHPEEQYIAGVPNDLLLPGAIVTLAAVIAGVFILSRPSGR
ncbi:CBS and PB1 domain protein [Aspergillus candidus]|uniref:CBS-domain-containing protein n=1 Tax=Aspergillus candidus TaxID=41067 RepID=A0A2I2F6V2_ASPCN|nr:CBS-domain-containing protein [Aspergillus candidus]PLB36380.1 CBS-domain-containing protein [Aspergillus candidus]